MKAMKAMKAAAVMKRIKAKVAVAMKAGPTEKTESRKVAMAKKKWTEADKKRQKQQVHDKCKVKGGLSASKGDRTSGAGKEISRGPRLDRAHRATEKAGLTESQLREAYMSGYTDGAVEAYMSGYTDCIRVLG